MYLNWETKDRVAATVKYIETEYTELESGQRKEDEVDLFRNRIVLGEIWFVDGPSVGLGKTMKNCYRRESGATTFWSLDQITLTVVNNLIYNN